jgi:glutaredoxin 3
MSITIYTTPTCGYCKIAKDYFKLNNIKFTEYDVSRDSQKAIEMVRKTGQMGVPVIEANGKLVIGFNRPELDKILLNKN